MKKAILSLFIIVVMTMLLEISADARFTRGNKSDTKVVATCSGSQLSLKEVEGEGQMGGKVNGNYVITNISATACTLHGFPIFVLLDKSGKVMRGVKVKYDEARADNGKTPTVTLEPKKTAWFQTFYSTGFGYDLKKSPPSSKKIKVTLPKTNKVFVLVSRIAAYQEISISAVRAGLPD